jgi:uncharacterized protein
LNTTLVCVATSSSALLVGLWLLLRRPGTPFGLPRVLFVTLGVALLVAGAVSYLVFERGSFFLAVNVVYCAVSIVAPLLALALLGASRRRGATRSARGAALLTLGVVPLAWHSTFVEPYDLVTEETTVELRAHAGLPRPLTVVLLSDLQMLEVSDHERDAVRRTMEARPDLIVLSGDMTQVGRGGLEQIREPFRELVAPLSAQLGVWAVHGDCESAADARDLLAGTNIGLLVDESRHLERDGFGVWLCGLENGFGSARSLAALAAFDALDTHGEARLVLAHRPDVVTTLAPQSPVDLVLCGHTHGGQVQLPWFGPPFILSGVPREVGAGGLHELGGHALYVSRGIGWEHGHAPRVRFRCAPVVCVLKLVPTAAP